MASSPVEQAAILNALTAVAKERRFPHQVFVERWEDYLFFEPYKMFDAPFVEAISLLMQEENAESVALINLGGGGTPEGSAPKPMLLERDIGSTEYISKLMGDGSPTSWMFLMDRYVCASDRGWWAIYCEKENDVAVFAIRDGLPISLVERVGGLLKARSVRSLSSATSNDFFDFDKLVPEWKRSLKAEYVTRGNG
jgi:hypothetical protein